MGLMKALRLAEFEDQAWFRRSIRDAGTDHTRLMWDLGAHKPIVAKLKEVLAATGIVVWGSYVVRRALEPK